MKILINQFKFTRQSWQVCNLYIVKTYISMFKYYVRLRLVVDLPDGGDGGPGRNNGNIAPLEPTCW